MLASAPHGPHMLRPACDDPNNRQPARAIRTVCPASTVASNVPVAVVSSIALGAVLVVVADCTAQATPPFALSPPPCLSPTSAHAIDAATLVMVLFACSICTAGSPRPFFDAASRRPVPHRTLRG
ncbi:uncharacterized protein EKO05_0003577 [Ascochyta rabiei]|uniref:Uncharacterized protein n=1 Tax=Didymella rabiei TaxID=5454 RepID=A0A163AB65_DIDRA|nr:uncharacterized protein EKO05_0003577 [Ascochyta rabiei]KZM21090.1 hypothetical protein ST47_g7759 [Ascochyta rabiei]UPX13048.1 hypothetical protein EKO05_0003577 [Ascochyta rabiei]